RSGSKQNKTMSLSDCKAIYINVLVDKTDSLWQFLRPLSTFEMGIHSSTATITPEGRALQSCDSGSSTTVNMDNVSTVITTARISILAFRQTCVTPRVCRATYGHSIGSPTWTTGVSEIWQASHAQSHANHHTRFFQFLFHMFCLCSFP